MSNDFPDIAKGRVASISKQYERRPSDNVSPTSKVSLSALRSPDTPSSRLKPSSRQYPLNEENLFAPRWNSITTASGANLTQTSIQNVPRTNLRAHSVDEVPVSLLVENHHELAMKTENASTRLFGSTGHFVDPMIKAFAIQDNANRFVKTEDPRGHGNVKIGASRGVLAWLERNHKGQREWLPYELPCAICHATPSDADRTVMDRQFGFCSSLNLTYNDYYQYAWSFGSKYVVLEKQYWELHPEALPAEVWATRLLKTHTKTPVPNIVAAWKEGQVAITITERAKGRPLADTWRSLSEDTRNTIAAEVAGYIRQWRRIKSPKISALDGGPYLNPERIIGCSEGLPTRFETENEYHDHIRAKLTGKVRDDELQHLIKLMPTTQPFVFTHGNLTLNNIFIDEGHVCAIIGLDRSAFLPAWAESLATHFSYGSYEREWKQKLFEYIAYPDIKSCWDTFQELQMSEGPIVQHKTMRTKLERPTHPIGHSLPEEQVQLAQEDQKGNERKPSPEDELRTQLVDMVTDKERGLGEALDKKKAKAEVEAKVEKDGVERGYRGKKPASLRLTKDFSTNPTDSSLPFRIMKPQRQSRETKRSPNNPHTQTQEIEGSSDNQGVEHFLASSQAIASTSDNPRTPSREEPSLSKRDRNSSWTPTVTHPRSGLSAFRVKEESLVRQYFPRGLHLHKPSGTGNDCTLRAVYQSFGSQYPELKGYMTPTALRESLASTRRGEPKDYSSTDQVEYMADLDIIFNNWCRNNLPDDINDAYRLGCIVQEGDECLDGWLPGEPDGRNLVWVFRSCINENVTQDESEDLSKRGCYQGVFPAGGSRSSGDVGSKRSPGRHDTASAGLTPHKALTPNFPGEKGGASQRRPSGAEASADSRTEESGVRPITTQGARHEAGVVLSITEPNTEMRSADAAQRLPTADMTMSESIESDVTAKAGSMPGDTLGARPMPLHAEPPRYEYAGSSQDDNQAKITNAIQTEVAQLAEETAAERSTPRSHREKVRRPDGRQSLKVVARPSDVSNSAKESDEGSDNGEE